MWEGEVESKHKVYDKLAAHEKPRATDPCHYPREPECPAFMWDGARLVPSDPRTLARRQDS